MTTLFQELARLGKSWWRVDRIRASGRGSRLLWLREGSALRVERVKAAVRSRTVGPSRTIGGNEAGPVVRYACLTAMGNAELEVRPRGPGAPPEVRWRAGGSERRVDERDVEVFPRHANPPLTDGNRWNP